MTFLALGATIGTAQFAFGVFILPLEEEFGWSRTQINVSLTLGVFMGVLAPFLGRFMDAYGARRLMALSLLLIIAGFFLRAIMTELWQFYAFSALIFAGTPGASMLPTGRIVGLWFATTRGRMMGFVTAGNNFGGMIAVPATAAVIAIGGWRWGFAGTAILLIGVLVLVWIVIRDDATDVEKEKNKRWAPRGDAGRAARAALQGFTANEAIRTRAFWFLAVGMTLQQFARTVVATQMIPHLEQVGFSTSAAVTGLTILAFFAMMSKIVFGRVSETITARWAYVAVIIIQVTGLAILTVSGGSVFVWAGLIIFGSGMGGVGALGPLAITEMFGLKHFGGILGLTRPGVIIPTLAGPIMAGVIFDATGKYDLAFGITLIFLAIAAIAFVFASPPKRRWSASAVS
ncbi:MAG: MFS transporter [Chloroflexi bacterium]|nr:MFS transporter [Chloroflexota bacterium]